MPGVFMLRFCLLAGTLTALTLGQAAAQQPTQAQREAIRASCRADFMANCAGVEPGGREALECLQHNDAKLSAACREAVNAVAPKPAERSETTAPAAPPETKPDAVPAQTQATPASSQDDALKAVQSACTLNDLVAHCSWIAPNNPEILLCLKANAAGLSPGCQAAVQSLPAATAPVTAPVVAAPPPPPPPIEPKHRAEPEKKPAEQPRAGAPPLTPAAAAAPSQPSEQQKAAIRAACRSDFMSHCAGVQPGGAAALQCLQRNAASLSGACRSAVAAIGGGGAPATGTPAAAATPAVAPIGPMPMMRPREALAILRICGVEAHTLCAGVPMGGGRIMSCLAENAASLSPSCYSALQAAAGR
jgi:outer membrane biosynthesis protein TonB